MSSTSSFETFGTRVRKFIQLATGVEPEGPGLFGRGEAPSLLERRQVVASSGASGAPGFDELARELFALQFELNSPYRAFCKSRQITPHRIEHWSRIPAIPTSAFKEFELTCLRPEERTAVFHSSGTTQQRPSRHFHSETSLALYRASLLAWFEVQALETAADGGGNEPQGVSWSSSVLSSRTMNQAEDEEENEDEDDLTALAILTPTPAQAPHSSLVYMFETIRRAGGAPVSAFLGWAGRDGAWTLDLAATTGRLAQVVAERRPVMLLGTAFSLVHLLDYLSKQNLRFKLPPGSRALETGGYKGRSRHLPKPELHSLITSRLGIPPSHIICEYGMSELSSQAYQVGSAECGVRKEVSSHFLFPRWVRVRVVSAETGGEVAEGETGLLQVFDLANVYSVMAIQTEDLAIRRGEGFELLGRAALAEPRGCSLMPA